MDWKIVTAVILLIAGALVIFYHLNGEGNELKEEDLIKVSYGNIQVTAIYLNPRYPELTNPTFYFRLDTHSGDLYTYDLLNRTFLEVGGERYRPIEWKEDENSWGHHRYGVFTFPESAIERMEKERNFRLVIELDSTRVMEWRI